MTPARTIEQAYNEATKTIADYLEPNRKGAKETLDRLIQIIDDTKLCDAIAAIQDPPTTCNG